MDICITDTNAELYSRFLLEKVLGRVAKLKKDKYKAHCITRQWTFSPLVYLVDGMACNEAKAFEKHVASPMAMKHDRQYSEMLGFVQARMLLAVICST